MNKRGQYFRENAINENFDVRFGGRLKQLAKLRVTKGQIYSL